MGVTRRLTFICPDYDYSKVDTAQRYFVHDQEYERGYIDIPMLLGDKFPEQCLSQTEIISSTASAQFDLGSSYGACGFISEKCDQPLGAEVETNFYIGYRNT